MPFDPTPARKLTEYGKLFLDAAELIRKHGHTKGITRDENGHFCMEGAMLYLSQGHTSASMGELENKWAKALGFPGMYAVCRWNNALERTPEEVIARFEQHAYQPA